MRYMGTGTSLILLAYLLVSVANAVPPIILDSEQRIASMELNRSTGNMTGDDYLVACVFAFINDTLENKSEVLIETDPIGFFYKLASQRSNSEYNEIRNKASSKFPEYKYIYLDSSISDILSSMMRSSAIQNCTSDGGCISTTFIMPLQGYIDTAIDNMFNRTCIENDYRGTYCLNGDGQVDEARALAQSRLAEGTRQKAIQREKEERQKAAQQEKIYYQLALDAHYKNLSENYTSNLTVLLNQSMFDDALNLSDEAIKQLVSPYSNIMMISRGDIFTSMGRFEEAIESFQNAQKEFICDNESADYQGKVQQDFEDDWNTIILYKINLARQKLYDQITAKKHNLRNAPNIDQLLSGHDGGREYSVNVENNSYIGGGYKVTINLSAVNEPIDPTNETDIYIKASDDTEAFVPLCIDIFGSLFADKRVAHACVQNNETYLDRFGHRIEVAVWQVCMDNITATRIGNWNDFKSYIGIDMNKLSSVASVKTLISGEE